jgi:hypothetical protein
VLVEVIVVDGIARLKVDCRSHVRRAQTGELIEVPRLLDGLLADWPDGCAALVKRRCDRCDALRDGRVGLKPYPKLSGRVICAVACARRREWTFQQPYTGGYRR